ncbi:MAG: hypothetical protein LBS18_00930 [Clostridiales bacterium]|nr:hypothetical protein [Clostridiales bacterium]
MPKYAPQSLPLAARRKAPDQRRAGIISAAPVPPGRAAIRLGQYIRRERGIQGARAYAAAIHEYLPGPDYRALCRTLGMSASPPAPRAAQNTHAQAPRAVQNTQNHPRPQGGPANQMQVMQMLSSLMQLRGGGNNNGAGDNGMNPLLLAQLLNTMGN